MLKHTNISCRDSNLEFLKKNYSLMFQSEHIEINTPHNPIPVEIII